jgi:N-acyl-D-aspartate/D-glutamate deacylase
MTPVEMVIAFQLEGSQDLAGGVRLRSFSFSEEDVESFMAQPWVATSTDAGISLAGDGGNGEEVVHPRYYGTFPRKIRHYALDRRTLSLENAVRSSTSLPAQILGLRDRGLIHEGLAADIVILDLTRIRDRATFTDPYQYSEGIDDVLVNGTFVVDEGRVTGALPGVVLTKRKQKL